MNDEIMPLGEASGACVDLGTVSATTKGAMIGTIWDGGGGFTLP